MISFILQHFLTNQTPQQKKISRQPNALTKLHFRLEKQQNRTKNQQNSKTEKAESQSQSNQRQSQFFWPKISAHSGCDRFLAQKARSLEKWTQAWRKWKHPSLSPACLGIVNSTQLPF